MKNFKKLFLLGSVVLSLALTGCGGAKKNDAKAEAPADGDNKIVIGVSPTPHGEIIEGLKPEFEKEGLDVEVVNFDDYIQPNLQLEAGDLDANYFQHLSLIHISEPTRRTERSRMPSSA